MTSVIGGMQNFEVPQILFNGPGPDGAVRTVVMYMYSHSFTYGHLGYGATISYALFGIIFVMGYPAMKKSMKKGDK